MPEVVYYVAASLDECIATSDGGIEWLSRFEGKGEDYGYAVFYASIEAVLPGTKAYPGGIVQLRYLRGADA